MRLEHHTDCVPKGDNPKGFLRRLFYNTTDSSGVEQVSLHIRTPYYLCDGCDQIIMLKQEELIKANEKQKKKLEAESRFINQNESEVKKE